MIELITSVLVVVIIALALMSFSYRVGVYRGWRSATISRRLAGK